MRAEPHCHNDSPHFRLRLMVGHLWAHRAVVTAANERFHEYLHICPM